MTKLTDVFVVREALEGAPKELDLNGLRQEMPQALKDMPSGMTRFKIRNRVVRAMGPTGKPGTPGVPHAYWQDGYWFTKDDGYDYSEVEEVFLDNDHYYNPETDGFERDD